MHLHTYVSMKIIKELELEAHFLFTVSWRVKLQLEKVIVAITYEVKGFYLIVQI